MNPGEGIEAQEADLVRRLQQGDDAAYEEIVRKEGPRLLQAARRLLGHEDDARDAVQEAFLSAFRAIDGFEPRARLSTWLYRILFNTAMDLGRRRRRRREEPIEALLPRFGEDGRMLDAPSDWEVNPEDLVSRRELRRVVREAIDALPDGYREILLLRDIEQLNTREAAEILGISEAAARTRLHRARLALRSLLDPALRKTEP